MVCRTAFLEWATTHPKQLRQYDHEPRLRDPEGMLTLKALSDWELIVKSVCRPRWDDRSLERLRCNGRGFYLRCGADADRPIRRFAGIDHA